MPDPEGFQDLHFPKAGINVVAAFSRQPNRPLVPDNNVYARTTPVGVNVRGYEALLARVRGGSRSGLVRGVEFPGARVNGVTWVVQELNAFAWIGESPYASFLPFLQGYYALDDDLTDSSGHERDLLQDVPPAITYGVGQIGDALTSGGGFRKPLGGVTDNGLSLSGWFFASSGTGGGAGTGFGRGTEVGDAYRLAYRGNGVNGDIVVRDRTGTNVIDSGFTLTFGTWHFAVLTYDGSLATLYIDGSSVGTYSHTLAAGWSALTFGINSSGDDFASPIDEVGVWDHPLSAADVTALYNSGAGANPVNPPMQLSQSGRVVQLVAVSQGIVKVANPGDTTWTATVNNTGETPPLNYTGVLYSSPNNQLLFFVDGINYVYYKPSTNSVELWSTSVTAGTLPQDSESNYARLICTWRGRTVLSGLLKDPQNIFMSAVSDPFNWDYAPVSATPTQAVALNLSDLGFIGDAVTALIPYTDDVLIVGTDHEIRLIRGDPMGGGQVDLVSKSIGIAWGEAYCVDPYGTVYFISNRTGVYSLVPGQQPVRISQSIEPLLQSLDMGRNLFTMAWDDRNQGFHLFITWVDEPKVTTHYFYETRTAAWWQDQFADTNHNPLCCVTFDGNDPNDRRVLIGCWDGYVRSLDPTANTDDGTAIATEVWVGPLLTKDFDEILLKDIQGVLGESSGEVDYAIHIGTTAEAALASDPINIGTLGPGRNLLDLVRFSGHAIYVVLTSTNQWSMEAIRARIATQGKVRRRGA